MRASKTDVAVIALLVAFVVVGVGWCLFAGKFVL